MAHRRLHPHLAAAAVAGVGVLSIYEDPRQPTSKSLLNLLIPAAMAQQQQPEPMSRLKTWLVEHGADINHIDFRASKVGQDAGVGVYLADGQKPMQSKRRRWWAPFGPAPPYAVAADFPLSMAITAENILHEKQAGQQYSWLLERGVLDERQLVQCHLAVEHARGEQSPLYPWMAALPTEFHTPLCWTDSELSELRGTTLAQATLALRRRLQENWRDMRIALAEVATKLGSPRPPSFEDLLWAHCVFWSRGQSLPVPTRPGAASQIVSSRRPDMQQSIIVHEGIVPGLDFANHQGRGAGCWWEVVQPTPTQSAAGKHSTTHVKETGAASGSTTIAQIVSTTSAVTRPLGTARIRLQLHRGWQARPGDELTINYGDGKPNEELLLLYGFVSPGAAHADTVMVACPVPPSAQWDNVMAARMELLMSSGMRPQFFLRAPPAPPSTTAPTPAPPVPVEVLEALEVFTLQPSEVAARLDALHAHQEARQKGHSDAVPPTFHLSGAELDLGEASKRLKQRLSQEERQDLAQQLGLRMAAVTTYIRLLEVQLMQLEHPEQGTGSLEADDRLLAGHTEGAPLPYRRWCAVVYRAGQKRVLRAHLTGARLELQRVLALLAQTQEQ